MNVDKFTKFILSVIAFSLCLNALNPWISPTLANANDNFAMERTIKKIAGGINKVADNIGKIVEIEAERFEMEIFEEVLNSIKIIAQGINRMANSIESIEKSGKE